MLKKRYLVLVSSPFIPAYTTARCTTLLVQRASLVIIITMVSPRPRPYSEKKMIFTVVQKRLWGVNPLFHKKRCPLGDGFSREEKGKVWNLEIFQTVKLKKIF